MTYKYYYKKLCLLTPFLGLLELHLTIKMCTNNNQKMLADSFKGLCSVHMIYVRKIHRLSNYVVLLYTHSTYTIYYTEFRFRVQESRA
jgi:hypothetical protein